MKEARSTTATRQLGIELGRLPAFSSIEIDRIEARLDALLAENRTTIAAILANPAPVSWDSTLAPIEELQDRLQRMWSPISHLHSVADSDALRAVYSRCLPKLSDYATELQQNATLYAAYREVAASTEFERLGVAEQRIVSNALRDFRLAGVELPPAERERFRIVRQELSQAQTKFEENVLDATHAWYRHVTDENELSGLPDSARSLARQAAQQQGKEGSLFTLDFPSYQPVMTYADHRELRRDMYEAYTTRASDQGPNADRFDNSELMRRILDLRHELARLVGFSNYAEYSLATKMARDPQRVLDFLNDLARRSRPFAEAELQEIESFAAAHHGATSLEAWDIAYYSEKLRQHKYALSQEELRPYFPVPRVLQGLFDVVGRLYGLTVSARAGVDTWHPDVQFFEIHDADGNLRGEFYLDLYARAHKRGGAWMDECIVRKGTPEGVQIPVAYLTCNFTPPIDGGPSLLTHTEVITLFHEFGHGLHHMLTLVDRPSVAGINGVAWDAVELPSQFLENWCWEREALDLVSGNVKTGQPIDDELYARMRAAKNFQAGMQMVRQLEFALFDFRLHLEWSGAQGDAVQRVLDEVRQQVAVVRVPRFNRFQHGFSHIFAGGYAAGYYSYKWAEVLSADAFSRFEEEGVFNRATGERFKKCILEQGGAREPLDLFMEFRGREPSIEPLLRHSGIGV